MIEIQQADSPEQLDQVRALIREFVFWHRQEHHDDLPLIDEYFSAEDFEDELILLPGEYAPPRGQLLLALYNGEPAGCVALRELDAHTCEMKRMFVYPHFQGKGIGRILTRRIIEEAKRIGYSSIRLDTSIRQIEAQTFYHSLGFERTASYYELPERLKNWLVFMELKL
ncbi:MAG TPA: GNAT family N-acetyltransferase [Saprospiraceae bacterium]|nr:GNAT family N-acetyltransferase [Saprospiraceae bacterium]